jgi:hypothetical protein
MTGKRACGGMTGKRACGGMAGKRVCGGMAGKRVCGGMAKKRLCAAALLAALLLAPAPGRAARATATAASVPTLRAGASVTVPFESNGETVNVPFSASESALYKFAADGAKMNYSMVLDKNGVALGISGGFSGDNGVKVTNTTNAITKRIASEVEVYLHKGEYYVALSVDYPRYDFPPESKTVTLSAEQIAPRFGPADAEPNESFGTALNFAVGGRVTGYLAGWHDDGKRDEADWYVFTAPAAAKLTFTLETETVPYYGDNDTLAIYDDTGGKSLSTTTLVQEYIEIEKLFRMREEVEIPAAGTYYVRVYEDAGSIRRVGSYVLYEGAGGLAVAQGGGGKRPAAASSVGTGVLVNLPSRTTGTGFNIYRAESSGAEGALIAARVTGAAYVDVNVQPAKTYYYTVREVFSDGSLGEPSGELSAAAPDEIIGAGIAGEKGFILMAIDDPMMSVNGEEREVDPGRGTAPLIVNGRTLVPIRAVVESMGGAVGWDGGLREITLDAGGHSVVMRLDSTSISADGANVEIDVAPAAMNDRTMVPVRFVAENVGAEIEWINATRQIVIVFGVA